MTHPLSPLVCSGRRAGAGPGRQVRRPLDLARQTASVAVLCLIAALVVGPAVLAVLSMVFANPLDGPAADSIVPVFVVPIFELGRLVVIVVLAIKVIRTTEMA